ncbi:hypothetical protein KSP40_PGU014701 [Platanthera guangdongensis]|uniref:Uncharacterized protein n=1 Tax=Platanthera guangdongensis TaxID=2320717 RepID=A0ABR2MYN7_9ASPA
MGNCHATDSAAAVIRHPDGGLERLFWPTTAGEVMRRHPGHYVALITLHISGDAPTAADGGPLRFTRVRILKHTDILFTGHVYRLVTRQEVTKALQVRKLERTMKGRAELHRQQQKSTGVEEGESQMAKDEGEKLQKQGNSRQWRPSLKSISEAGI